MKKRNNTPAVRPRAWPAVLLVAAAFVLAFPASGTMQDTLSTPNFAQETGQAYQFNGICYSPYLPGQSPDWTGPLPAGQVRSRLELVAPSTDWVRSYGTENGLEEIGRDAHELGLKVAVGAWLGRDHAVNERQIANLIAIGQAGEADVLIVGSEVLLRGDLSESELISYVNRVKQAVPGIPVTTADTDSVYMAHPALFEAVDIVYVHNYPFWQGVGIDDASTAIKDTYARVKERAGSKAVAIAETGWPSAGEPVGAAVPSVENAERYIREFTSWARSEGIQYYVFESFDEDWKKQHEGERGAHWGVFTVDGTPKYPSLMTAVTPPASPQIWFVSIPPMGDPSASVTGATAGAVPGQHFVTLYIRVDGKVWGAKPSWSAPLTSLNSDGTWSITFNTDGNDQAATEFAAYLLPAGVSPPELHGEPDFPAGLAQYPHVIQIRPAGAGTYAGAKDQYTTAAHTWEQAWGSSDVVQITQYLNQARTEFATCLATANAVNDPGNAANLALLRSISTAYIGLADAALAMYDGSDIYGAGRSQMTATDFAAAAASFQTAAAKFDSSKTLFSQATTTLQSVVYAGTEYSDGTAYTAVIVPILNAKAAYMGEFSTYAQGWQHTALAYQASASGDQATFRNEATQAMNLFDGLRRSVAFGADATANYDVLAGLLA